MFDKQMIFDVVVAHLIQQNAKALMPNDMMGRCAYRGAGGLKCAVGKLIPDDAYNPAMEGTKIGMTMLNFPAAFDGLLEAALHEVQGKGSFEVSHARGQSPLGFLADLQAIHDGADVSDWPQVLRDFALNNGINPDAVDAAVAARDCGDKLSAVAEIVK